MSLGRLAFDDGDYRRACTWFEQADSDHPELWNARVEAAGDFRAHEQNRVELIALLWRLQPPSRCRESTSATAVPFEPAT